MSRDFETDISKALIEGVEFVRDVLENEGWDSAYVDLELTAFIKDMELGRYKRLEYEDEMEISNNSET